MLSKHSRKIRREEDREGEKIKVLEEALSGGLEKRPRFLSLAIYALLQLTLRLLLKDIQAFSIPKPGLALQLALTTGMVINIMQAETQEM